MTTPKLAVATDRGRYYYDPNPDHDGARYPSVTNIIDTSVSKPALVPWAAKVTAEYAVEHLPWLSRAVREDRDAAIKELKAQVRYVRDTAADLGTRIHDAAEATALGAPHPDDPEIAPYLKQYLAWCASWGLDLTRDLEAAECSVVNRTYGYAGTADVFMWMPTGIDRARELWLIDMKSSATKPAKTLYVDHVLQLAALRYAEHIWLPDGTEAPVPPVAGCAVLALRRKSHAFMPVAADRAAFAAFTSALATTRYLHAHGNPSALALDPAPAEVTTA